MKAQITEMPDNIRPWAWELIDLTRAQDLLAVRHEIVTDGAEHRRGDAENAAGLAAAKIRGVRQEVIDV